MAQVTTYNFKVAEEIAVTSKVYHQSVDVSQSIVRITVDRLLADKSEEGRMIVTTFGYLKSKEPKSVPTHVAYFLGKTGLVLEGGGLSGPWIRVADNDFAKAVHKELKQRLSQLRADKA